MKMTNIILFSYGANLPIYFDIVDDNDNTKQTLTNEYQTEIFKITHPSEPIHCESILYLFRKNCSVLSNEWVIKTDINDCIHEAIQYHKSDSFFEEDVVIHTIYHKEKGSDPEQFSVSTLLKTPGRFIHDMFFTYFVESFSHMNEREAIQESFSIWKLGCQEEMSIIKEFVNRYPDYIMDFGQKLYEYQCLMHAIDEKDRKFMSLAEFLYVIRSCRLTLLEYKDIKSRMRFVCHN